MLESIMQTLRQTGRDLLRVLPFLVLAIAILWGDAGSSVVIYAVGISLVFAVVSHFVRRTFFPYLDTKLLLQHALKEPLASAVAFVGICILLGTIFQASISLLK